MSRTAELTSRSARMVGWAQLFLFSLNVAWITVWCGLSGQLFFRYTRQLSGHWPARYFGWRVPVYMPESPYVLHQVILSFGLCVPLFFVLLLLARTSRTREFLCLFAGAFAIAAYPIFALCFRGHVTDPLSIRENGAGLLLETALLLTLGALYYFRKAPLWWTVGVPLLAGHFSLWAWKAGDYNFYAWDVPSIYHPRIIVILIATLFFFGFPVIGFLSALSSGLYFRLSSGRAAPRADTPLPFASR